VFRRIPFLVNLFIVMFALQGFGSEVSLFTIATVSICIVATAFLSEVIRAGLESVARQQIEATVGKYLEMMGLADFRNHLPAELSGGMKQRAALARVLAFNPKVLLMDEPFGALDAQTREAMQEELTRLWERTGKTIVFVTHDIEEAVYLGDRVVVLSARPARIREEVLIDLPRPRDLTVKKSVKCLEYRNYIWDLIRSESA